MVSRDATLRAKRVPRYRAEPRRGEETSIQFQRVLSRAEPGKFDDYRVSCLRSVQAATLVDLVWQAQRYKSLESCFGDIGRVMGPQTFADYVLHTSAVENGADRFACNYPRARAGGSEPNPGTAVRAAYFVRYGFGEQRHVDDSAASGFLAFPYSAGDLGGFAQT